MPSPVSKIGIDPFYKLSFQDQLIVNNLMEIHEIETEETFLDIREFYSSVILNGV